MASNCSLMSHGDVGTMQEEEQQQNTKMMESFSPRQYQLEMLRLAKMHNVIVKLDTGSGKTFIACLLINQMLPDTRTSISAGGKRIIFLVKQVHLVIQQAAAIRRHTYLDDNEIGEYHGQIKPSVDFWSKDRWAKEFDSHRILVFTAGVFKDVLEHAKFSLGDANLLILDECHHSAKQDDFAHICRRLDDLEERERPKVLGLTASVVNGNPNESKIKMSVALLERLMHARVVTSMHQVEEYKREVREIFAFYNHKSTEEGLTFGTCLEESLEILTNMVKQARESSQDRVCLLRPYESQADMLMKIHSQILSSSKDMLLERAKRSVSDVLFILAELGPWAALFVSRTIFADLSDQKLRICKSDDEEEGLKIALKCLNEFIRTLEAAGVRDEVEARWVSHKVMKLVEIITVFYLRETTTKSNYRGIIFVNQRQIAYVLCKLLGSVDRLDSSLKNVLRLDYVTGHGESCVQHAEVRMALKVQSTILNRFRSGDINLLVATRVIEEGMDVRACNLVIKFDFPEDYRSYVQSRGRARAEPSSYIVFLPTMMEGAKQRAKMNRYKQMSDALLSVMENRAVDREWYEDGGLTTAEELVEEELVGRKSIFQPSGPDGPRISLHSATGVLNRYVGRLRHDCLASPQVHIFIGQIENNSFGACVMLPMPCPVRDVIFGPLVPCKKRARKWAALIACERLYEAGVLGEDLLPLPKEKKAVEVEEYDDDGDAKVGTRKRRRDYDFPLCDELSVHQHQEISNWNPVSDLWAGQRLCLHEVHLQPSAAILNELEVSSASLCLSLLLPTPLGSADRPVASFPLFFIGGAARSHVRFVKEIEFSSADMSIVLEFHKLVIAALIGSFSTYVCSEEPQTPLDNFDFNLNNSKMPLLLCLARYPDLSVALDVMKDETANASRGAKLMDIPRTSWTGSIIRARHYRSSTEHIRERWIVKSVSNFTPQSPYLAPEVADTFADYFFKRYGARSSTECPLVEVCRLPTLHDTAVYRQPENISRRKHRVHLRYMMPEFCERNPLSVSVWSLVAPVPAICYRLNHLLLLKNLHSRIWGPCEISVPVLKGPWMKDESPIDYSSLDLTDLGAACTLIEARDFHNLERMEVLGDSFLKFSTSTCLLTRCSVSDSEGDLSQRRGRLVSNANLYRCARQRGLERCVLFRPFSLLSEFLPPGFVLRENQEKIWQRRISDKSLSDMCEGLIGFALMHGSLSDGMKVMHWLGVDPGWEINGEEIGFPSPPEPLVFRQGNRNDESRFLDRLCDGLEKIETKLGYKFKRPEFLLQAVTHASCVDNRLTDCYQKLEFLGDAVLDFLITKFIFHQSKSRNPGELTDLRSALVNNDIFSALVVRLGIHKHLKHSDKKLFQLIPLFEENRERCGHNMRAMNFGDDAEEKVMMKILGDLFESVIGAIFLDCNYDLEVTWKVVHSVMHDVIDDFSQDVPKNAVRVLHETFPDIKFGELERDPITNLSTLSVKILGKTFTEQQRNKKACKLALAKKILLSLNRCSSHVQF